MIKFIFSINKKLIKFFWTYKINNCLTINCRINKCCLAIYTYWPCYNGIITKNKRTWFIFRYYKEETKRSSFSKKNIPKQKLALTYSHIDTRRFFREWVTRIVSIDNCINLWVDRLNSKILRIVMLIAANMSKSRYAMF
jgi:hypothetical protein